MTVPDSTFRYAVGWRYNLLRESFFYWRACRNWREVIRCRWYKTALTEIITRSGLQIQVHAADVTFVALPIFLEVWRDHSYLPKSVQIQPKVIVDIGAHVGFFSIYAAQHWPHATILALEPDPGNFAMLQQNIERNALPQITALGLAVSGRSGQAEMIAASQSDAHSFIVGSAATLHAPERFSVAAIDLSELLTRVPQHYIDFLKIDCEGAEFDFLAGQSQKLMSSVGYLAIEYHEWSISRKEELVELLSSANFKIQVRPDAQHPTGKIFAQNMSHR